MLEGLVAWVLNNYLGKYVENLNTDQLSIAILSGEVELENLPLRRDALRHLGIPIEIRSGHIGKVKLQIPIRSLRSSPWVIMIEGLYLVAGPLALDEWDQAAEELAEQERKLAALDAIEAYWRVESDGSTNGAESSSSSAYYASSYSSWLNYGTGVITDIVENMQLHINDVHLRYEDSSSLQSGSCACGLTIESLSAQCCDAAWVPQFTSHRDAADLSYKAIELRRLAVYWDSVVAEGQEEQRRYLVAPVSACARLQRNRSELPLRSAATPRIVCDLHLDQVPLSLVDWQYEQMVSCVRGLEFMSRVQHHRRRRPTVSVSTDPRAWWIYAAGCHVTSLRCRQTTVKTWPDCLERARQNVRYVEMYTRLLAQPSAALGADSKILKDTVEWSRDFSELRALREVAMRRVSQLATVASSAVPGGVEAPSTHGRNVLVQWFPQWWGWYSTSSENTEANVATAAKTASGGARQLEDEILEALADSARNNTLLRRDVVFGRFNFELSSGTLELRASNEVGAAGTTMLELQFSGLVSHVVSRPRSSAYVVELSLGTLCLRDCLTTGTLFPVLVGPPGSRATASPAPSSTTVTSSTTSLFVPRLQHARSPKPHFSMRGSSSSSTADADTTGPLFHLIYEATGVGSRRLHVRSRSLDVVYQPAAARWLVEFVCAPHQRSATRLRLEQMRARTRQQLTNTWGSMLEGRAASGGTPHRVTWDLRFDISAPQLILVERFCDPSAIIAVIDLGTLRLENGSHHSDTTQPQPQQQEQPQKSSPDDEDEEEDAFMTPCSTPPGSEAGDESTDTGTLISALSEQSLHQRLYDTYRMQLRDIQVLVGRVRDNWRHAHTKGSSALHVLDRFHISLQVERRIVPTTDPMYPSVSLVANLPRLVAHINEAKLAAVRTLMRVIGDASLPSPFGSSSPSHQQQQKNLQQDEVDSTVPTPATPAAEMFSACSSAATASTPVAEVDVDNEQIGRLLILQFTVENMSLEVQSRGRSVAELQVSGVTASLIRRPCDTSISLTVHGLLLVDALQTYGPDFELLVASHRHVGMDSMSGSLRDSEPTSPTSPGSPDPGVTPRMQATSPVALSHALSGLAAVSPPPTAGTAASSLQNTEALISVKFTFVNSGDEALQIANIQFNNLDIIANQETIVELVGFIRRVSPRTAKSQHVPPPSPAQISSPSGLSDRPSSLPQETRIELTFDFHRLSVLLLRGAVEDGRSVGRKIGTATMCEARIQATLSGAELLVDGSLGGLQVLDLTPEGQLHQRIVSVGKDPFADEPFYYQYRGQEDAEEPDQAFSFEVHRSMRSTQNTSRNTSVKDFTRMDEEGEEPVEVSVRMASVWYTHAPHFLAELRSCATEFKQYLADVARSIRSAATDVALGLVHARTEALARLSAADVASPRRLRRRSTSSESHTPYTPYTPLDYDDDGLDESAFDADNLKLDIVLETPVLVLPRSSDSSHVFVAHLGKITINNTTPSDISPEDEVLPPTELINGDISARSITYTVEIRDMNMYTLDTGSRRDASGGTGALPRVARLYDCVNTRHALPVLHDTLVRLQITQHHSPTSGMVTTPGVLLEQESETIAPGGALLAIRGRVLNELRVSLTRAQYEQLLDTLRSLGDASSTGSVSQGSVANNRGAPLAEIAEEDVGGVSTLSMDPHVRAKLFPSARRRTTHSPAAETTPQPSFHSQPAPMRLSVRFDVASFEVELCGLDGVGFVGLSFGDFLFTLRTPRQHENHIQLSLRSLLVEDLRLGKNAPGRRLVASREDRGPASQAPPPGAPSCISKSCPADLDVSNPFVGFAAHSLPDHLDARQVLGAASVDLRGGAVPRLVGPLRTRHHDLVMVSCYLVDPAAPDFDKVYNSLRKSTTVDFGSVDVVVSASSWLPLLEFFRVTSNDEEEGERGGEVVNGTDSDLPAQKVGNSSLSVTVRALALEALRGRGNLVARARLSEARVHVERVGARRRIRGQCGALHVTHGVAPSGAHACLGERLVTVGEPALHFQYTYPPESNQQQFEENSVDAELVLNVSPFVYVHTKRFVAEVRAFFIDFSSRNAAPTKINEADSTSPPTRVSVRGSAASCSVIVPIHASCSELLVLDVGRLSISNEFHLAHSEPSGNSALLDVTTWRLHDVDIFAGEAFRRDCTPNGGGASLFFGECAVIRRGNPLLTEKCTLEVRVDRNLTPTSEHRTTVADMTTHCRLSTLDLSLSIQEYALVRGVLTHNFGEDTEWISPSVAVSASAESVWTLSSVRVELLDVRVRLQSLACINFVRSRLTLDSFSDLSQDVDLVSRHIIVTDERPKNSNVFLEVLRPAKWSTSTGSGGGSVQAEVHSRRRRDLSKFTVLLNNMRVMALPDWWRATQQFIFTQYPLPDVPQVQQVQAELQEVQLDVPFEFKLNITDSEIVVVEDAAKPDTNAVILRSTTLITYRPGAISGDDVEYTDLKPLSCSVNHLELFSCALQGAARDADEDTALSIVDPVTITADVHNNILDVQLHELTLRVSYRDLLMFAAMLESLSKQTQVNQQRVEQKQQNSQESKMSKQWVATSGDVSKLGALGFGEADCKRALVECNGRLDDAALWLTQHATPVEGAQVVRGRSLDIRTVEVHAACVRLCFIDDCGDVDVPLAEASLSAVCVTYETGLGSSILEENSPGDPEVLSMFPEGTTCTATVECTLSVDYYNRVLGGWEPCVEPWRGRAVWRPEEAPPRYRIAVHSDEVLDVNVTDSLLALLRQVRDSWTRADVTRTAPRSPFVPFALRNDTGVPLYFAAVVTEPDEPFQSMEPKDVQDAMGIRLEQQISSGRNLTWIEVSAGETVPFSFDSGRAKQRHKESHRLRTHQLAVRVSGWHAAAPVTIDRVGVYFRHAAPDRSLDASNITAPRSARLVFDVRLEGSARKLVTVRSALRLVNRLPDAVDVKLVERSVVNAVSTAKRTAQLRSGATYSVPVTHAHSLIFVRPSEEHDTYSYCAPDVPWGRYTRPGERSLVPLRCTTNRGVVYHLCTEVRRERFPVGTAHPGHTLLLLPALLLVNLLPHDLHYAVRMVSNSEVDHLHQVDAYDLDVGLNIGTSSSSSSTATVVARGHVPPGRSVAVPAANPDANLDISVHVENFRCVSGMNVSAAMLASAASGEYTCRIRLEDSERRRLLLRARVEPGRGARLRVSVSAPYWLVNRTGLPLVFRQEGVGADAAGQFEEHEVARMVAPLLFSFADEDASPTVVARVGTRHPGNGGGTGGTAHWCQQFHLRRGVQVRRLRISPPGGGPDTVYVVGVEVTPARGQRHTSVVTVAPRHQLHNRSALPLEFAQGCHATTVADPAARAARVHAPPGCHVPFHWPRLDRDQLLCVRCTVSSKKSAWSGGIRIDGPLSCHVLLRDEVTGARVVFLHAEVVAQGATYCVVFSDATALPPPLRVDNCSEVALTFAQFGCSAATVAHAHRAVPYAWDEPAGHTRLVLTAPGSSSATYDVDRLGRAAQLTYENFIYIAFTGTFRTEDDLDHYDESDYEVSPKKSRQQPHRRPGDAPGSPNPIRLQRLVLDVPEGSNGAVILARKQPGQRSQLWRMTSTGQLQHEGSAQHTHAPLVLDIETPAPQPSAPRPARLALRRMDPRRRSTQTWRFTSEGRLCCVHRNTCVQAPDGLLGLRPGSPAVLDSMRAVELHRGGFGASQVPLEQMVGKQRMRPGSGLLAVEITTDGPTRVIRVTDMKQRDPLAARALAAEEDWHGVASAHRPPSVGGQIEVQVQQVATPATEIQVTVMLRGGLGVSVIGGGRELLYLQLNNIIAEAVCGSRSRELCVSVQDAQCDNQLADTDGGECPVVLHAARARSLDEARRAHALPVLELRAELQPAAGAVRIFKHFIVCVRPLAIHLEETLLLRMYEFLLTAAGTVEDDAENAEGDGEGMDGSIAYSYSNVGTAGEEEEEEEAVVAMPNALTTAATATVSRYHFGIIRLVPGPLRLSVHTAAGGTLSPRLRMLKRRLGLTLVGFEDAPVELEPYVRHHPFETGARLRRSIISHFRDELMWQAAAILGSVDFLGSPLGLLGDVTEGVSGLIRERSVGALVLHVAHGLSNSAAKVTETLGDGLGRVSMDDAHEEMRQRIRRKHAGSGGEHIVAGIKGLGFGLLGGATGIFKQVYEGASNDGLQGVFSGLGKGLVGAVAKPVQGVLDLATETARAVRDSSRGASRAVPARRREPRAALGPGGLLPRYNIRDSRGQTYLRALFSTRTSINITTNTTAGSTSGGSSGLNSTGGSEDVCGGRSGSTEQYVAYECVRSGTDDLRVIVSSQRVRVVTGSSGSGSDMLTIVTETGLGDLESCAPVMHEGRHYIEMSVRGSRRPRIRCDTEELARAVVRQVNYAKRLHEEAAHTLYTQDD